MYPTKTQVALVLAHGAVAGTLMFLLTIIAASLASTHKNHLYDVIRQAWRPWAGFWLLFACENVYLASIVWIRGKSYVKQRQQQVLRTTSALCSGVACIIIIATSCSLDNINWMILAGVAITGLCRVCGALVLDSLEECEQVEAEPLIKA